MALVDFATGTFIEANEALLHYTQYSKDEFLNLSFWDITPKEYEKQEQEQMEELNRVGSFGPNYKEYIRKDGSRFPISIRGFILSDVDGRKLVWGIIEDLSKKPS
jgi:PAS domain S-box-containing protein